MIHLTLSKAHTFRCANLWWIINKQNKKDLNLLMELNKNLDYKASIMVPTNKKIIQYIVNKIYLDINSTTQIDPNVLKHMIPYFNEKYGNPSSQSHAFGWEANAAVEIAREQVAQIINAKNEEIVFTSGATESNNLVIYGLYQGLYSKNLEIITTEIEHKAY